MTNIEIFWLIIGIWLFIHPESWIQRGLRKRLIASLKEKSAFSDMPAEKGFWGCRKQINWIKEHRAQFDLENKTRANRIYWLDQLINLELCLLLIVIIGSVYRSW